MVFSYDAVKSLPSKHKASKQRYVNINIDVHKTLLHLCVSTKLAMCAQHNGKVPLF